jgi:hypothetical protein
MSAALLEIVELPSGEIILQRVNGEGEPLVRILFSPESEQFLREAKLEVAKVMIHAGVQAVGQMADFSKSSDSEQEIDEEFEIETEFFEEEMYLLH